MVKLSKKKLLLSAIGDADVSKLLDLSLQNKSKKSDFLFLDALKSFTIEELETSFSKLFTLVENHAASALEINAVDQDPNKETKSSAESAQIIQVAVDLGLVTFNELSRVPTGLLQLAVMLHGVLLGFTDEKDSLKNSIAHLCEKMYHNKIEERDQIIPNVVIYILKRTLRKKATKTDVKRIWALKTVLQSLPDAAEVDKEELFDLLQKCASSNLYLSVPEGQKVISLTLILHISYCAEIHECIKRHLPSCSVKHGEAYGKIYFDAWSNTVKNNLTDMKEELELKCIQDLMYHAVHVRRNIPKSLVPILRKLMAHFHSQKKETYVSKMLRNLYEPILWRSLKISDGDTRANAAQLFFDVFPLEDPDFNIVETQNELTRQMILIKELLLDEYPVVRSSSVIGVCVAMSVNWELFSPEMLKTYFKILIEELSCDSSSAEVRCAVVKGMKILLENHLATPTLRAVLPKIQGLFHDVSEKVRVTFCHLLLQVKKMCAIKYYEVVPIEHLLARLEEDSPVVAKLIVNLIHNSYFPKNELPEVWLARCVEIIKADRGASRVLFQHISNFITLEVAVKFMIQACRAVHLYAVKKTSNASQSKGKKDKENVNCIPNKSLVCLEETLGFQNPDIVAGILDGIVIMWVASQSSLEKPENKDLYKLIVCKFSKYLRVLLVFFKNTSVWESVSYLSSFLPPTNIPNLSNSCLSRLKGLSPDAKPHEYVTLLECLCNQNQSSEILEVIKDWIQTENEERPVVKKFRGKKKVTIQEPSPLKPFLGLKLLHSILDHPVCRNAVLKRNPDKLQDLLNMTDIIKRKIEISMKDNLSEQDSEFMSGLFYALLKISVLLQGEDKCNAVEYVEDILSWTTKNVTKHLTKNLKNTSTRGSVSSKKEISESWKKLMFVIYKDILRIVIDMTVIGFVKEASCCYLKFALDLLKLDNGSEFLLPMARLLLNSLTLGNYLCVKQKSTSPMQKFVVEYFCETIYFLKNKEFMNEISPVELKESQNILSKVMQLGHIYKHLPKESVDDIVILLIKTIVEDIQTNTEDQEMEVFQKISIPPPSLFLLSTISVKSQLIVKFLKTFCTWLNADSVKDVTIWISCYVILLHFVQIKNVKKTCLKEVESSISFLEKHLTELYPDHEFNEESDGEKEDRCDTIPANCYNELLKLKELVAGTETS